MEKARLLDFYRLPGFEIIYKLYGYDHGNVVVAGIKFNKCYLSVLYALYDNRYSEAESFFVDCLRMTPSDPAVTRMLDNCRNKTVKMHAFRTNFP